jgi:hypothetical protein
MLADQTAARVGGPTVNGFAVGHDDEVAVSHADITSKVETVDTGAGARTKAESPIAFIDAISGKFISEK